MSLKGTLCTELYCDKKEPCPYYGCRSIEDYECLNRCPIYHFTHGKCIPFAISLKGIFDNYSLSCIKDEKLNYKIIHAFCKHPYNEGYIIDARGAIPLKYLFDIVYKDNKYTEKNVYDTTVEELLRAEDNTLEMEKAKKFIIDHSEEYNG